MSTNSALDTRDGLPDALRYLVEAYPRDIWTSHTNFDGLTRFWLSRHQEFRRGLAMMHDMAAKGIDRREDPDQMMRNLQRVSAFFTEALHGHHYMEDAHYFPKFTAIEPGLDTGFVLLDSDHHALEGHINRLEQLSGKLTEAALGHLYDHLNAFETFLDRHLTDEEDLIVPIILKHGAPDV